MRTIHKYPLAPGAAQVSTYEGVRFLHVDTQHDEPVVWAEVNTLERERLVTIHAVPTGGSVPAGTDYLGTFQLAGGNLVFHAYAEAKP